MQAAIAHTYPRPHATRMPTGSSASVDGLVDAMRTERRLLEELVAVMQRQRGAVTADDLQGVDDSVFATHRVLVTLGEARRRRRTLTAMLTEQEDVSLSALDEALGMRMTEAARDARDLLRQTAELLSLEVAVNRQLLRDALAVGDDYVRTLAGAAGADAPVTTYPGTAQSQANASGATPLVINRRI